MGGAVTLCWRRGGETWTVDAHTLDLKKFCDPRVMSGEELGWDVFLKSLSASPEKSDPEPRGYGLVFLDFDERKALSLQGACHPFAIDLTVLRNEVNARAARASASGRESKPSFFSETERLRAALRLNWLGRTEFKDMKGRSSFLSREEGGVGTFEEAMDSITSKGTLRNETKNPLFPEMIEFANAEWDIKTLPETPDGIRDMVRAMTLAGIFENDLPKSWDEWQEQMIWGEEDETKPSEIMAEAKAERESKAFDKEAGIGNGNARRRL